MSDRGNRIRRSGKAPVRLFALSVLALFSLILAAALPHAAAAPREAGSSAVPGPKD